METRRVGPSGRDPLRTARCDQPLAISPARSAREAALGVRGGEHRARPCARILDIERDRVAIVLDLQQRPSDPLAEMGTHDRGCPDLRPRDGDLGADQGQEMQGIAGEDERPVSPELGRALRGYAEVHGHVRCAQVLAAREAGVDRAPRGGAHGGGCREVERCEEPAKHEETREHSELNKGKVIVRFTRGTLPLFDDGGVPIDIKPRVLKITHPGCFKEWSVVVHGPSGRHIEGRIVAMRLNDEQASKALDRLKREKSDKDISAEDRECSRYIVVFATVPKARLSAKMVIELYRLRWLVELQIKRDKSIGGLDRVPNFRDDTIESWVCAKLLLFALARRIAKVSLPTMNPASTPRPAAAESDPTKGSPSLPDQIDTALRRIWSITKLVWKSLSAALLPISLAHIGDFLPKVVEHLTQHDPHRHRESTLERCRRMWTDDVEEASNDTA